MAQGFTPAIEIYGANQALLNQRWQEKDDVLEEWQRAQEPAAVAAKASADASSGN